MFAEFFNQTRVMHEKVSLSVVKAMVEQKRKTTPYLTQPAHC